MLYKKTEVFIWLNQSLKLMHGWRNFSWCIKRSRKEHLKKARFVLTRWTVFVTFSREGFVSRGVILTTVITLLRRCGQHVLAAWFLACYKHVNGLVMEIFCICALQPHNLWILERQRLTQTLCLEDKVLSYKFQIWFYEKLGRRATKWP